MTAIINPFAFGAGSVAGILDGLGFSAAWSPGRLLLSAYAGAKQTNSGGAYDSWLDQTGNGRTASITSTSRPLVATAGPNSRACGDFDGSNDWLNTGLAMSTFMSSSTGYMIVSVLPDTITPNDATNPYNNAPVMGESGGYMGLYLRSPATPKTAQAFNYHAGNTVAEAAVISTGSPHVLEWWHSAGSVFLCVNNGTPVSVTSGTTDAVTGTIALGHAYTGGSVYLDGKIFEAAIASAVPATRSAIAADFKAWCGA